MRKILLASVAALVLLALASPAVSSAQTTPPPTERPCNGTLTGFVPENVVVPRLGSCVITDAILTGRVRTAINARSLNVDSTVILGDLTCQQCRRLDVTRAAVGGTFRASETTEGTRICGSTFGGDATMFGVGTALVLGDSASGCSGNVFGKTLTVDLTIGTAQAERNVVGDDFLVTDSRQSVTLNRNLIDGTLSCENNLVQPTGSGNIARAKTGQCAGL